MEFLTIKELKKIIENLPDEMIIIHPVIDEIDTNKIYGFRKIRTAGILSSDYGEPQYVFCLNSANNMDLCDQIYFSGMDVEVESVLFGDRDKKEN